MSICLHILYDLIIGKYYYRYLPNNYDNAVCVCVAYVCAHDLTMTVDAGRKYATGG